MHGIAILLAAASVGVDYGWQATANGDVEYIIQIEPELIAALQKGEAIISEIHPDVRGVRRFRIQIGSTALPRFVQPALPPVVPATSFPVDESPANEPPPAAPLESTFSLKDKPPLAPFTPARQATTELPNPNDFPLPLPDPDKTFPDPIPSRPDDRSLPSPYPAKKSDDDVSAANLQAVSPPKPFPGTDASASDAPNGATRPIPLPDPDRLPAQPHSIHSAAAPGNARLASEKPTSRLATFHEPESKGAQQAVEKVESAPTASRDAAADRPWLIFSVTILALFASLGANAYLGYILIGMQRRHQDLRHEQLAQTLPPV